MTLCHQTFIILIKQPLCGNTTSLQSLSPSQISLTLSLDKYYVWHSPPCLLLSTFNSLKTHRLH